jgi:hypothetical protein
MRAGRLSNDLQGRLTVALMPAIGEDHWCAVLSTNDVIEIIDLIGRGWKDGEIALRYRIDKSQINRIRNHRIWKHLTTEKCNGCRE